MGITESDFWNMTLAELDRALASRRRVIKTEAQEKATFDYILADLIGRSINRIYSSAANMPDISSVYPALFDSEEIKQKKAEQQIEVSALRFRQFAASYNAKFKGV